MSSRRNDSDATDRWHLSFPDVFPLLIALRGMTRDEGEAVAASWCARLRERRRAGGSAYTIVVERSGRPGSWAPPSRGAARVRYARGAVDDCLVHRGGAVRLTPGRRSAEVWRDTESGRGHSPLLELLDTALMHGAALRGVAVLHAGAFRLGSAGVLVVGASFSGKTTLVAASLHAGSRLVSDDTVLLGRDASGRLLVRTTCRDAHLRRTSRSVVPPPLRRVLAREGSGAGVRWALRRDAIPERFALACAPSAVLRVRVDRRRKQPLTRRLSPAELLAALINASSPLMVSPRYAAERAALMPLLVTAAETVPGFEVRVGTDLLAEPEATVRSLLAAIGVSV